MTERREVGQVEIHYPYGLRMIPIYDGEWSAERVFEAYDLFESEGKQYRVRVLRELTEEECREGRIWTCVAQFPPET